MSTRVACRGKTKKGTRCQHSGNEVLDNGFCRQHQYQAIREIRVILKELQVQLDREEGVSPELRLTLERQIKDTRDRLVTATELCQSRPECSDHLKDLLVDVREAVSETQREAVATLAKEIAVLSTGTSGDDAVALRVGREMEWARRSERKNEHDDRDIRHRYRQVVKEYEESKDVSRQNLTNVSEQLEFAKETNREARSIVQEQDKRMAAEQAHNHQFLAQHQKTIAKLYEKLASLKSKYENVVGREAHLRTSISHLTEKTEMLKVAFIRLQTENKAKVKRIQAEFSNRVMDGRLVLSEREESLKHEVETITVQLTTAIQALKDVKESRDDVVEQLENAGAPHSMMARQLQLATVESKRRDIELSEARVELLKFREQLATRELTCAKNVDDATEEMREEIMSLSNRVVELEQITVQKRQDAARFKSQKYQLEKEYRSKLAAMNFRLVKAKEELKALQDNLYSERKSLERKRSGDVQKLQLEKAENNAKYNQILENLREEYRKKNHLLREQMNVTTLNMNEKIREAEQARSFLGEAKRATEETRRQLVKEQTDLEEREKELNRRNGILQAALAEAEEQAKQRHDVEERYRARYKMMRQNDVAQKKHFAKETEQLKNMMKILMAKKEQVKNAFQRCSGARVGLVNRTKEQQRVIQRLERNLFTLKTSIDANKVKFEQAMQTMRHEVSRAKINVADCARRLGDASLVHDHVEKMKEQARKLRNALYEKIRAAKSREDGLQRLIQDREMGREEINRLRQALKQCSRGRKDMERTLEGANTELRELGQANKDMGEQYRQAASDLTDAVNSERANMVRSRNAHAAHEEKLQQELEDTQFHNSDLEHKNVALARQKAEITAGAVASDIGHAEAMQRMADAQRIGLAAASGNPVSRRQLATGKSKLFESDDEEEED